MRFPINASVHLCLFLLLVSVHPTILAHKTITEVLSQDSRFETLLKYIQATRLVPVFNEVKTGTLFAPDNDAFARYQGPAITNETLLYHLIPRNIPAAQFHQHQVIESSLLLENYLRHNTSQRLLIHRSSPTNTTLKPSMTSLFVNDAQVVDLDIPVNSETVIHVVNKVLQPPDMIPQAFALRNTDLYQMMEKVGLVRTLNQHQPFTVFYSDQSILESLNEAEIGYLLSDYGYGDLLDVLGYLVIHGDIYADDFIGEKQYRTLNGDTLVIKADKDKDTITVNGQLIIQKDILAANGVLHKVKSMPITDQLTFDTRKYLYGINTTKFVSLLDEYGLGYYLAPGVTNFTFLVPDNDAINEDSLPDNDKKAWLSYHILHGQWDRSRLHDQQLIASENKSPQLDQHPQQVPVYLAENWKSTIYFGNARVYGNSLTINNNVIYQLSNPMDLPPDVFLSIVVDLELSSFIATLYVSKMVDQIKGAKGITLFAPMNQAYQSLGLVATYLLHPTGRHDLQTTLQYHAAHALLYEQDLRTSTYNVTTFTGQDVLTVGGVDGQGRIIVGGGGNNSSHGTIQHTNTLMANGVVHKIDTVLIPPSLSLTHQKILGGMEAHRVLNWFDDFTWLGTSGNDDDGGEIGKDYILLAPTDRAFAELDNLLGEGWEEKDSQAYERLVRLHVIPKAQQERRHTIVEGDIETYPTLLSDKDQILVHDGNYFDEQYIQVVGKTGHGARARILAQGNLRPYAQVIQMDAVLIPMSTGLFGLPWIWSVVFVSILVLIGIAMLGWIGYHLWQRYRRSGYETIEEQDQGETNNNNYSSINSINSNNSNNNSSIDREENAHRSDNHSEQV